ncbi:MAG TPA: ribonuclease PH [Egibacteraceae bacterium]|jgi:ribonuclease PH|nr:ribonuclease PH [Egibacteraceae bacterium]
MRGDGRANDALRPVTIDLGVQEFAEGSALVSFGRTRVLCAASVEEGVPRWMRGSGRGWVTAEYAMLPRATDERTERDATRGRIGGRTHEIQRLIGRSLRAAVDLAALGEHSLIVDCDVLQADGGTRTAAITGGWVALALAIDAMVARGDIPRSPGLQPVSAVSVGVVDGELLLDLCYAEDVRAGTDMNVVMAGDGRFVEVQGTAEGAPFSRDEMDGMLDLAAKGCAELAAVQRGAAGTV